MIGLSDFNIDGVLQYPAIMQPLAVTSPHGKLQSEANIATKIEIPFS